MNAPPTILILPPLPLLLALPLLLPLLPRPRPVPVLSSSALPDVPSPESFSPFADAARAAAAVRADARMELRTMGPEPPEADAGGLLGAVIPKDEPSLL